MRSSSSSASSIRRRISRTSSSVSAIRSRLRTPKVPMTRSIADFWPGGARPWRDGRHGPRLEQVELAVAVDRPLDVLVAAEVPLDATADVEQRGQLGVVEAGDPLALLGPRRRASPRRRRIGEVLDAFGATVRCSTSPVTLLTRYSSGVTSPPTTARPRPQLALTATLLGSPVTGLQVNITPETSASTICWTVTPIAAALPASPSAGAVADRLGLYRLAQQSRTASHTRRRRAPTGTSPAGRRRSPRRRPRPRALERTATGGEPPGSAP